MQKLTEGSGVNDSFLADLNSESSLQQNFFNTNFKELNDLLAITVFNNEMIWFKQREGDSFDEALLPGYLDAAEFTFDRASYKVMRRMWEESMVQFRIDVKNLLDKHYSLFL